MKTHTIKTPTAELMIVELPHRTADFSVINTGDRIAISAFDEYDNCLDVMPISTDYTLLGKPDEIRENDARELVDKTGDGNPSYQGDWFVNYQDDEAMFETATESLLSAIETVVFWENPIKLIHPLAYMESRKMYHKDAREYKEAELHTFDRSRTLIFVKQ